MRGVEPVGAVAVTACVGAEEATVELGRAELLVGLEVRGWRQDGEGRGEDEGGQRARAGDVVAWVLRDVVVVRAFERFRVAELGEVGDADDVDFVVAEGALVV